MIKYIMVVPQSPSVSPAGHLTAGLLPSVTTLNVPLLCSPHTSPLPMQALSVRLVPAAVAVSRRGKRTDWACASVLYGAVDFFGGE